MTDRIRELHVVLEADVRDDEIRHVVEAISMIKGVGMVEHGQPLTGMHHVARRAVRVDIMGELHAAVNAICDDKPYAFDPDKKRS